MQKWNLSKKNNISFKFLSINEYIARVTEFLTIFKIWNNKKNVCHIITLPIFSLHWNVIKTILPGNLYVNKQGETIQIFNKDKML